MNGIAMDLHFDDIVEKHTNYNLLYKDCNNNFRRLDFK